MNSKVIAVRAELAAHMSKIVCSGELFIGPLTGESFGLGDGVI